MKSKNNILGLERLSIPGFQNPGVWDEWILWFKRSFVFLVDNGESKEHVSEKTDEIKQGEQIIWEVTAEDLDRDAGQVEDILKQNLKNTFKK